MLCLASAILLLWSLIGFCGGFFRFLLVVFIVLFVASSVVVFGLAVFLTAALLSYLYTFSIRLSLSLSN